MIDSHCHLDDEQFAADRNGAIERALAAGVDEIVVIGTGDGPPDMEAGIRLADECSFIHATVGVHPQYAARSNDDVIRRVEELARHPKVIAIGEIGLDYHWHPEESESQFAVFIEHMRIAREARKPIVIHTREAWDDTIALLREHWAGSDLPCVMHCFTGGPEQARQALELGCYLSFAGVVTYPKATAVHESAKMAPLDRILVETDAPYLAPVPHRGKRNEPAYVVHTALRIADLRGESLQAIDRITTSNWQRVFRG